MGTKSITVKTHPLAEVIARKLSGIESVPKSEQTRMVNRAIRAAVEWYEEDRKRFSGLG